MIFTRTIIVRHLLSLFRGISSTVSLLLSNEIGPALFLNGAFFISKTSSQYPVRLIKIEPNNKEAIQASPSLVLIQTDVIEERERQTKVWLIIMHWIGLGLSKL